MPWQTHRKGPIARQGLHFESDDGLKWLHPTISFLPSPTYFKEPPNDLDRKERFERPQLLMGKDGRPTHLFCAFRGGRFGLSSGAVLWIRSGPL